MKKIKKYIIICLCIILLLVFSIVIIMVLEKNKNAYNSNEANNTELKDFKISEVKEINEYANIEKVVNIYNSALNQLDADLNKMMVKQQDKVEREKIKKQYYEKGKIILENILEQKYLSKANWENDLTKYSNNKLYIDDMKKFNFDNMEGYIVSLTFDQGKTEIIVFEDLNNNTFSILPSEYLKDKDLTENKLAEIINNLEIKTINENKDNIVTKFNLTEEQICIKYFNDYLNKLRNDQDKLYETLDKKYREERFENINNFKDYIKINKSQLEKSTLSKYQIKDRKDYIEYICVDEDGKYYIFNATKAMNYSLYLDLYTVDLPEFIERYKNTNDQGKVALNIEKVFAAINNKDYKYVYSKLADSFKSNYFKDEESLKIFLENKLYDTNNIEYEEFKREGGINTYKIKVTKEFKDIEEISKGKNAPSTYLNIVMQLNEGTDFVFSFSLID